MTDSGAVVASAPVAFMLQHPAHRIPQSVLRCFHLRPVLSTLKLLIADRSLQPEHLTYRGWSGYE
jgi:hypothetical protein